MNIVYDLFLNFQEEAYEFFEWNKQDTIEHVKKIPMFRVSNETVRDFTFGNIQVTEEFLKKIEDLTEKYDLEKLQYACLFSDGKTAIVLEFGEDGHTIYKSKLLPEDEEEVVRYILQEEEITVCYQILTKEENPTFFTRKEYRIKNFLEREIMRAYQNEEHSKLQYLYLEYFNEIEEDMTSIKDKLLMSMQTTLNKKHWNLYEMLLLLAKKKKV